MSPRRKSPSKSLPVLSTAARTPDRRPQPKPAETPVVAFISLGCSKNLVDSEAMLGRLAESGCVVAASATLANTVVVNTCGFLESSRDEALAVCREMAERKRAGEIKRLVVAGCLVQRDGEKLAHAVPEIDALVGVNNRDDIVRAVWHADRDARVSRFMGDYHAQPTRGWSDRARLQLTPQHYAYVRISEGCDQKCTFCTIPSIRGPMHCKTPQQIVAEGRELIENGTRELLLIGQDTTSYGHDIDYGQGLAGLLRTLDEKWDGADWIRLMYVYPSVLTDEMIDAIAECERVVKYIDIPLQHISDRVLRAMYRRVTRKETESLLEKLRSRIPGVTIRTTFIVGFPGETDAEFDELLDFVREQRFDAAGAFKYSLEPDTPAGRMKHQIDAAVKHERRERFMQTQQEIAFAKARTHVGRPFEVVVDSVHDRRRPQSEPLARTVEGGGAAHSLPQNFAQIGDLSRETLGDLPRDAHGKPSHAISGDRGADDFGHGDTHRSGAHSIARHAGQAPEVDPVCLLKGVKFEPGQRLRVKCTAADGYDLVVKPARTALNVLHSA